MAAIITDSEVITSLGKIGTGLSNQDQATLLTFKPGIINAIKQYIGYDPCYQSEVTEFYPLSDIRIDDVYIGLRHLPVRSIVQVKEDFDGHFGQGDSAFAEDALVAGTDYVLELDHRGTISLSGGLKRLSGNWSCVPGSVRVKYECGFKDDEFRGQATSGLDASSIKSAALLTFKKVFETVSTSTLITGKAAAGPLESERAGDYSYKINTAIAEKLAGQQVQLSSEAQEYLASFINYNELGN